MQCGSTGVEIVASQQTPLQDLIRRATGRELKVKIDPPRADDRPTRAVPESMVDEARHSPTVARAMELFDARIVDVREDTSESESESGGGTEESTDV